MNEEMFATVHEQVEPVLTARLALAPAPERLKVVVETEYVHAPAGGAGSGPVGVSLFEHAITPIDRVNTKQNSLLTAPPEQCVDRNAQEAGAKPMPLVGAKRDGGFHRGGTSRR
jgi:hypothetical protein